MSPKSAGLELRALRGQRQQPRHRVGRKFDDAALAGLGHAAVERDGAFGQVHTVPSEPGDFGGAEAGEEGDDGVGQEQAVFVCAGGGEKLAAVGEGQDARFVGIHGGLVHQGDGIADRELAADAPIEKVGQSKAVVHLVARRGAWAEDEVAANVAGDVGNVLLAVEAGEHPQAPAQAAEGVRAAVLFGPVGDELLHGVGHGHLADGFAVVG